MIKMIAVSVMALAAVGLTATVAASLPDPPPTAILRPVPEGCWRQQFGPPRIQLLEALGLR